MNAKLKKGKKILSDGGVIIFPTETVYGLGADATNTKAVKKIYKFKKRPRNNPIICHFKNINEIEKNFILNDDAYKLANNLWPGPLTLILEKKNKSKISKAVSNNKKLIGCRIPSNPIAKKLLFSVDFPIAAPSANLSTMLSSTKISHLSNDLKNKIFFIDGGRCVYGLESTVVKINDNKPVILRLGSITIETIRKIIPKIKLNNLINSKLSPGQQIKHYSPNKPIRINVKKIMKGEALLNFGKNNLKSKLKELNLSSSSNLDEAAKNFYDYLHKLDVSKCDVIAVAPIPNNNLGKTMNDRLKRASSIE